MRSGIEAISGYEPVQVVGASRMDNLSRVAQSRKDPIFSRLVGTENVKTVVLPHEQRLRDPRFEASDANASPGHLPTAALWRNRDAMPRAWLVRQTYHVEGHLRLLSALTAPDFDPTRTAIVSGITKKDTEDACLEWGTGRTQMKATLPVIFQKRSANTVQLISDAGTAAAFLVYSGTGYPGWSATVDGHPASLYRANVNLMGVPLSPGKHEIILQYAPECYRVGLFLSLLAASGLTAGGAGLCFRTRRSVSPFQNRKQEGIRRGDSETSLL